MEICGLDVAGRHPGIGDLDALPVSTGVDPAGGGKAGLGSSVGDQLDNDLMADQRLDTPALGDEGEQAVLDTVLLAGAGRPMAAGDGACEFIGQDLQFAFPQTHPRAVAAAAIPGSSPGTGDQQPRRARIAGGAEFMPAAPDALDGEGRSVVVDAEIDPSGVGGNVVNPAGTALPSSGMTKSCTRTGSG